jgi:hypothetical protein
MELIKYTTQNELLINCLFDKEKETIWMSQKMMSLLFGKSNITINRHVNDILKKNELDENLITKYHKIKASDDKIYNTKVYKLEIVFEVGCRVKSIQGIQFRRWCNKVIHEYIKNNSRPELLIVKQNDDIIENNLKSGFIYFATTNKYKKIEIYKIGQTKDLSDRLSTYNCGRLKEDHMFYVFTVKIADRKQEEKYILSELKDYIIDNEIVCIKNIQKYFV